MAFTASRHSKSGPSSMNESELSVRINFSDADWRKIPASPGVYVIYEDDKVIYVGMAGRNGNGTLRSRLRDHCSGQIVNMFAQFLFLAKVQFLPDERITHPRAAKAACHDYIVKRCSFRYRVTKDAAQARECERVLKRELKPELNP